MGAMINDTAAFNEDIHMAEEFIHLRDVYGIKNVVETGTYHGVTTDWMCQHFDNVFTSELNKDNFVIAKRRLAKYKNVYMTLGDSAFQLQSTMKLVGSDSIVFLDAHWYTNPVLRELQSIADSGHKPIIVIHDFKVPDKPFGFDEYKDQGIVYEWSWIEPSIDAIYGAGNYDYYYNEKATGAMRGCVFIIEKGRVKK